ncbi:MAG TPA: SWIM zinc finger family protein [Saprospiraceae bacterium]|nr:SWIM zinc finger family protein [Saprospiraceae bacterium]
MKFSESQIRSLAPDEASMKAGKGLSSKNSWVTIGQNDRVLWGEIKGSGAKPYQTQIDLLNIAFKCSCPSRKFPCKHGIGLMLVLVSDPNAPTQTDEPSWVAEWINKRAVKSEQVIVEKTYTEEELSKLEKGKEKRAEERAVAVEDGVAELTLWFKDLIKSGLIHLPNKDLSYFNKTSARMIDAKAPGLASWVKSLSNLNYASGNDWQLEALQIICKTFLLLDAYKNIGQQIEEMQVTIKNLIGWSQSPKDLLADDSQPIIKDIWLVLGQEEKTNDDIIVQKTWLLGLHTNEKAMILNFGTKFSPMPISVMKGSILEAEMVFFPGETRQRAIIKLQNQMFDNVPKLPELLEDFEQAIDLDRANIAKNPWWNDTIIVVKNVRLLKNQNQVYAIDSVNNLITICPDMLQNIVLNWFVICANGAKITVGFIRNGNFHALGIFKENNYIVF